MSEHLCVGDLPSLKHLPVAEDVELPYSPHAIATTHRPCTYEHYLRAERYSGFIMMQLSFDHVPVYSRHSEHCKDHASNTRSSPLSGQPLYVFIMQCRAPGYLRFKATPTLCRSKFFRSNERTFRTEAILGNTRNSSRSPALPLHRSQRRDIVHTETL